MFTKLKRNNILIFRKNIDETEELIDILSEDGYLLHFIESIEEMKNKLDEVNPELIIISYFDKMYDLADKIKENSILTDIPILIVIKEKKEITKVFEYDIEDYFFSPYNRLEVKHKVTNYLRYNFFHKKDIILNKVFLPIIPNIVLKKSIELALNRKYELPNQVQDMTVLFGDIVSFTSTVETLDPIQALQLLNIALSFPIESIERNNGYVDKFLGDGIMALFENPIDSVKAAIQIQYLFYELNQMREMGSQKPIHYRIGINTGQLVIGNVGKKERREWTAIGDVVNTASRIEHACKIGEVFINESTYNEIQDSIIIKRKIRGKAKGKKKELILYSVKSIKYQKDGKDTYLEVPDIN